MSILLAALSAMLYGSADFAGGLATRRNPVFAVLVVSQLAGTAFALLALPLLGHTVPRWSDMAWGAAAGLGGAFGIIALYRGIATSIVSIVSPASAVIGAIIPVIFGVAAGERPSTTAWIGVALCLPAVLLLTQEGRNGADNGVKARRALLYGLGAGAGFGCFFIAISRPAAAAGLWPLIAARSMSIVSVAGIALLTGKRLRVARKSLATVLFAGVFDMGANVAFIIATRGSDLALVTIVTSLFPAPTVLLAWIFFRERLSRSRFAGLIIAIAGVILISLG